MVVTEKIEEAKYFLDKIKKANERKDFIPNASAFLSAARSIPDWLLEDYNVKYGLKISVLKRLDQQIFEDVAKARNNPNAIAFIKGYNKYFNKLKRDKIAKLLLVKRNIKVHRTDLPLQANFAEMITENIPIHDGVAIEVRDKYGNLKMKSDLADGEDSMPEIKKPSTLSKMSFTCYFDDYKDADVVEVCKEFLRLMNDFVKNLTNKYG